MNVLGDCFGAGIVQHFSRKHLDKATQLSLSSPLPPPSASEYNTIVEDTTTAGRKSEGESYDDSGNHTGIMTPPVVSGTISNTEEGGNFKSDILASDSASVSSSTPPIEDTYL